MLSSAPLNNKNALNTIFRMYVISAKLGNVLSFLFYFFCIKVKYRGGFSNAFSLNKYGHASM